MSYGLFVRCVFVFVCVLCLMSLHAVCELSCDDVGCSMCCFVVVCFFLCLRALFAMYCVTLRGLCMCVRCVVLCVLCAVVA